MKIKDLIYNQWFSGIGASLIAALLLYFLEKGNKIELQYWEGGSI